MLVNYICVLFCFIYFCVPRTRIHFIKQRTANSVLFSADFFFHRKCNQPVIEAEHISQLKRCFSMSI